MIDNYNELSQLSGLKKQKNDFEGNYPVTKGELQKSWLLSLMLLITLFFTQSNLTAQTTLLSPTGDGGFETGTTFALNGWTPVVSGTRTWQVGTAGGTQAGTRAAYVGAAANANGINASAVHHFYKDFVIPAGATNVFLNYYYKQIAVDSSWDFFYVSTTTTANTPVAGTIPGAGYSIKFSNTATVYSAFTAMPQIDLTSLAGTTVRVVFSFKSDGVTPHVSPSVDNISLVYTAGSACTGTPNAGTIAVSPASTCSGSAVAFTSSGLTSAVGITYLWQSSPTGSAPWTDLTAGSTYNTTATVGTTYYRLATTCSSSSTTNYSNTVSYTGVSCSSVNLPNSGSSTVDCGTSVLLYDNGGPSGDYTVSTDTYTVLDNSGTGVITLTGSLNGLETCCDYLQIYSGVGIGGTLLANINTVGPITQIVSSPGQSLTVRFFSDVSVVGSGFALQAVYTGACLTCATPVGGTASAVVNTFCTSGSTTISATGYSSGTGTRYQWESSTDNFATAGTPIGSVATAYTNLATGTLTSTKSYRLRVFCTASPGTPSYSNTVTVTINLPGIVDPITGSTICATQSATLTATSTGAVSFAWTGPGGYTNTGSSITVSPATTSTYTVTATYANNCTATGTGTVTISDTPTAVTVTPNISTVCSGSTVRVDATGGSYNTTYFSDNFDALSSQFTAATVSGTAPTATLNTTYQSQGSGSVLFNTTGISSVATYSLNSNVNLTGATAATLTFSHIASMEGNFTAFDFGYVEYSSDGGTTWTTFTTTNYSGAASNTQFSGSDVRFTTLSYTDWNSTLTSGSATPNNSLWKTETFTVPAAALTSQFKIRFRYTTDSSTNYLGWYIDNVKVTANGNTQYAWTVTPATTLYKDLALTNVYTPGTDFAPTVYSQPTAQTTYNVNVTTGTCSNSGSATVNVNPLPVITLANNITVCKGTGATITIPEINNNYSWSPGTGLDNTNSGIVLANPATTTTYTVTTTNTSNFCQSTKNITVNVNDPGTIVTEPTNKVAAFGYGTSYTVVGSAGVTYDYQWQIKTGASSYANLTNNANYADVNTSVLTVSNAGSGTALDNTTYRCLLTPPSPCADLATNDVLLTVSNTGISSSPSNVNICLPTPSTAQFSVVTNGDDPYLVEWQVSTDNGVNYNPISLIDVEDTFLYTGPNTTAVPGLTFEHPIDALNPNGTGSEFKVLNVSGIVNPATLKFKAIVNEVLPSNVATLTIANPVTFTSDLSTAEVIRCKTPASVSATNLSVTTSGDVTSVQWRYDTTPGGAFTNVVTNNTPLGSAYVASSSGSTSSLAVTTNGSTPVGSYYYKAFVTGSSACGTTPTQSNTATITVANPAVAINSSSASYCTPGGSAVTLTVSGAATYSWTSTPAGFTSSSSNVSVTPTVATLYSVIGTDSNGCTNTATSNVGVGTSFTVASSATPATVCPGAAVTLNAVPTQSGGATYLINTIPYQFTSVAGTFTPLTGTTVSSGLGATDDDTTSATLTPGSGFSFTYGGTSYTSFRVSSNGQLIFGTSGAQANSNDLATGTSTSRPGLAPLWDDLLLSSGVNYQMSGTAPNRVLTVEWLNTKWNYLATGAVLSFQVKLYETTNVVEYVYRRDSTAINSGSASIGLMGTSSSNFLSLQDTTAAPALSTTTSKNDISTKPTNGRTYRFTPVAPITYTYAWTSTPSGFNGTGITTTANPTVNSVYSVTATSNQGCTASNTTSVTVDSVPAVVTPLPDALNLCAGATATFTVSATSATPLTYVWKRNGSPLADGLGISGATTATLTITGTTAANNGSYTVDVVNCTTVTSNATVLTVNPLPTATLTGTSTVCQNAASPSVTFTGAAGTAPYIFTYTLNGGSNQTISTSSGNSVTLSAPTGTAGSFTYSLVSIQDSSSSACSQTQTGIVTITVNAIPAPAVLSSNSPVCAGNTLNLTTPNVLTTPNILSQNFESGLGLWTVTAGSTGGTTTALANFNIRSHGWLGGSGATTTFNSPGATKFILADADGAGSGIALNTQLTSPSFSTVGYTAASLSFRHYHRFLTTAPTVQISTDGGSVWTTLATYSATAGTATAFTTATVSLNAYIGLPNVKVRYNYTGGWIYYWAIDDISITGTPGVQTFSYAWSGPNSFSSTVQNPTIANATTAASGTYSLEITNNNGCKATSAISATVTAQPLWYLDADADHYYTGTSIPSCTSPGAGYTTTVTGGGDCADNNPAINPGATEICYNNIDDNCNTILSEGCAPVVVNMTPSYNGTILASLATAVPAVGYTYPGATNLKYRFTVTNTTTGASVADIIQTSRYVTIPAVLHSSPGVYTITASAVINDEVVPYAGNTITVNAPIIPLITLASGSCGATLATLATTLTANAGLNATGYTFRIRLTSDNGPTPAYGYSSSSTRFVSANSFTGFPLSYGTSYKVSVQYTYTDPVTSSPADSGYGAECTVITPSIPLTGLASPTCGSQVAALNANISATSASYATGYQFRIRLTSDNGPTPTYYYSLPNASRFSSLTAFQGNTYAYNTNYSISVQYSIVNNSATVWSGYGTECIVKTPFFPTTALVPSQCGLSTATSLTQQLNITAYPGFPNYKVKLDEISGEDVVNSQEIVITYSYFRLNQFSIAQLGKNYNVSVAIKQGGVFGDYSTACDLFTAAAPRTIKMPFKAVAYPNPFANNFMLEVKTTSRSNVNLKVYDMVGRLIDQRDVNVSDLETTTIGDQYPSGVYNVVVSQEDSVETVRVVKR